MNCPECGNTNPPGEAYCEYCGHPLGQASELRKTNLDRGAASPPATPDPGKRRTIYEPRSAASPSAPGSLAGPAAQARPSDAAPAAPPVNPFAAPPPERAVYDPSNPFRAALQAPATPLSAPSPPPRSATRIDRVDTNTRRAGAVLVAYARPDAPGVVHTLRMGRNTVGRDESNDIRLDDGRVSGQHAFVFVREDGASFIDVSTNGSVVDGRALIGEQTSLGDGGWLRLGGTCLVFVRLPALPALAWNES